MLERTTIHLHAPFLTLGQGEGHFYLVQLQCLSFAFKVCMSLYVSYYDIIYIWLIFHLASYVVF
jgi:hypothetical protein